MGRPRLRRRDRNGFFLRGHHAVLTGAPQLIVSKDDHVLIISAPNHPPSRSHATLVRLYMYALRRAQGPYDSMVLPGELVSVAHPALMPSARMLVRAITVEQCPRCGQPW